MRDFFLSSLTKNENIMLMVLLSASIEPFSVSLCGIFFLYYRHLFDGHYFAKKNVYLLNSVKKYISNYFFLPVNPLQNLTFRSIIILKISNYMLFEWLYKAVSHVMATLYPLSQGTTCEGQVLRDGSTQ